MFIQILLIVLLFFTHTIFAATTCPLPHQVEKSIKNNSSTLQQDALTYFMDKSLLTSPYLLSYTSFIGVELNTHTLTCIYTAFSQNQRKWGDILIKTLNPNITPIGKNWRLEEDVYVCMQNKVNTCAFSIDST